MTLTIFQHLERVQRTQQYKCWVNIETISAQVNVGPMLVGELPELECYFSPMCNWVCTDTRVGLRFYFIGIDCVCVSFQHARKSDEEFEWVSPEAYDRVRNLVLQMVAADGQFKPSMVDWNQNMSVRSA